MIRIAAAGDLHFGTDSAGSFRPALVDLPDRADMLLLAGDLTRIGRPEEAAVLAEELADLGVPVIAVLGNHDYHSDRQDEIVAALEKADVRILEGASTVVEVNHSSNSSSRIGRIEISGRGPKGTEPLDGAVVTTEGPYRVDGRGIVPICRQQVGCFILSTLGHHDHVHGQHHVHCLLDKYRGPAVTAR